MGSIRAPQGGRTSGSGYANIRASGAKVSAAIGTPRSIFFITASAGMGALNGLSGRRPAHRSATGALPPESSRATSSFRRSWCEKCRDCPAQTIRSYVNDCGLFAQNHAASRSQKGHPAGFRFLWDGRIPLPFVPGSPPDAGLRAVREKPDGVPRISFARGTSRGPPPRRVPKGSGPRGAGTPHSCAAARRRAARSPRW